MALPLFKERRFNPRKKLTGLLPGRLLRKETGEPLICKPVDVSDQGIGILIAEQLAIGYPLSLHFEGRSIDLEVAWGRPDFGKQDLFRFGLVLSDSHSEENLEAIFLQSGCLL